MQAVQALACLGTDASTQQIRALCVLKPLPTWARSALSAVVNSSGMATKPPSKRYARHVDGVTKWKQQPSKICDTIRQGHPCLKFDGSMTTRLGYFLPTEPDRSLSRLRIIEALHVEIPVTRWASSYLAPRNGRRVQLLPVPWDTTVSGKQRPSREERVVDPTLLEEDWDPAFFRSIMLALLAGTLPADNFLAGNDASSYPALNSLLQSLPLPDRSACMQSSDYISTQHFFHTQGPVGCLRSGVSNLPEEVAAFDLGGVSLTDAQRAAIASKMSWPLLHPIVSFWKAAADAAVGKVHVLSLAAMSYFNDIRYYRSTSKKKIDLKNAAEVLVDGIVSELDSVNQVVEMSDFFSSLRSVLLGYPASVVNNASSDTVNVPHYDVGDALVLNVECTVWDNERMKAINEKTSKTMMEFGKLNNYLSVFIGWGRSWDRKLRGYVWEERWVPAHRLIYVLTFGADLRDDEDVAHLCHDRRCLTACHLCAAKNPADNTHLREAMRLPRATHCFIQKRVREQQLEQEEHMKPIKKRLHGLQLPS